MSVISKQNRISLVSNPNGILDKDNWGIMHPKDISVESLEGGSSVKLTSTSSRINYVLNASTSADFPKLNEGAGTDIQDHSEISIMTVASIGGDISARVRILEYGADRERIGTTDYALNSFNVYQRNEKTKYIAFTFRIEGKGSITFSEIKVAKTEIQAPAKPASIKPKPLAEPDQAASSNTPVQRDLSHLPKISDAEKISLLLDTTFNQVSSIVKTMETGDSAETYKWRRRANDWQAKANGAAVKTTQYHKLISRMSDSIPESNGSRYFAAFPYKVAIVSDIYMYNFYKDSFESVTYLSPSNYKDALKEQEFDLFIYITCWSGIENNEWRGVKFREAPMNAMADILKHFKDKGLPTIFQSIEDPSNFEYFFPVASQFDWIFTSDSDVINRYKQECGHDQVFYCEYGANPLLNNPIASMRPSINAAFFAGSYPERYKERCTDMHTMFDSIIDSGGELVIVDRNYGSTEFSYPSKYQAYVLPPYGHSELQKIHKLFRYNLNFNSIKSSPTMCAMRVYELQAQGRAMLSNYAKSVFNKFPQVRLIPHKENMETYFAEQETDGENRLNMECVRNIMSTCTSFDIVARMLTNIGLKVETDRPTCVAVFIAKNDTKALAAFERQTYTNKTAVVTNRPAKSFDWAVKNNIGYIAILSGEHEYGDHYLQDMVNGFKYTDSDYITKDAYFCNGTLQAGKSHEYTNIMPANWRTVFSASAISPYNAIKMVQPTILENGYSIDPYQLNDTTPKQDESIEPIKPKLSVIIPVYNNASFLITKCIPSLQRNKLWPQMEILLIDDGSTEPQTIQVREDLAKSHPNITVFSYEDGGSGSASRPRNKGIELATADLVTFLDPDNEISSGGYDRLVDIFEREKENDAELGFVSGYQVKVTQTSKPLGHHTDKSISKIDDLKTHFFGRNKFPVISTQAAVICRKLFKNKGFRFVERAAGQDTLFGWELLCYAKSGIFTADSFLIYYAERSGSITNVIDKTYFESKLIMEKAQIKALKRHGILDPFKEAQLDFFIRNWYLKKLELVVKKDRAASEKILAKIISLYDLQPKEYGLLLKA